MHIIDLEALSEMFFGNQDKVKLVINALSQRVPEWQTETILCAEKNDPEATRQLCHRIRGAASSIKAEELTLAATELGDFIKTEQFAKAPEGFVKLNHCLDNLIREYPLQPRD